jgi:hypothetical protein
MFFYGMIGWDNHTAFAPAIGKQTVFDNVFNLALPPKDPVTFEVNSAVDRNNPGQTLVDLFSNLTLSIMTLRDDRTNITGRVWDGQMVWVYTPHILWAVYGTAIGIILSACLYAAYCTLRNGLEIDNRFSHLLVATRNPQLDRLCSKATSIDELREHELHWRNGVFRVENDSNDLIGENGNGNANERHAFDEKGLGQRA